MKIYLEHDDGETLCVGNGGARRFRTLLKKKGYRDNTLVGYHRGIKKMLGYTSIVTTETPVPAGNGYYTISHGYVAEHSIRRA